MWAGGVMALLKVLDLNLKSKLMEMQQSIFATFNPATKWMDLFFVFSAEQTQRKWEIQL